MKHCSNFSLLSSNTFAVDVRCREFYEYSSEADLQDLYEQGVFRSNWMSVGGGSNLLFLGDYEGCVLHSAIMGIDVVDDSERQVLMSVGAGVVWDDFVAWSVDHGLGGVENLSHIPGCVGASPVQNVGAYGVEAKDAIVSVRLFDTRNGSFHCLESDACDFGYRYSRFKREPFWIVCSVTFQLTREAFYTYKLEYGNLKGSLSEGELSLRRIRQTIVGIRDAKLPDLTRLGCAGSFFKNPVVEQDVYERISSEFPNVPSYNAGNGMVKIPAGWLIENAGWKGVRSGNVGVYEKQALVIVNYGGASGAEIWDFSQNVSDAVLRRFGVAISPEVCVVPSV